MATLQEVDVRENKLLSVTRSAMFKHKSTHRKPDPLMLLVILVSLAVMMTSAAAAGPSPHAMSLEDILDGEFMVAPVGRHGAGLHMSYLGHTNKYEQAKKNTLNTQPLAPAPSIFLSVQVPW
jgi:hypothetical protein